MTSAAFLLALVLQASPGEDGRYRIGAGDVIELTVAGRPDLSRIPTVQTTGDVWLPRVGNVAVQGLTSDEAAARIAHRLAGVEVPAPGVTVRIKEYRSQFVWVRGAVGRPGRKPLRESMRLVDALLEAGGFLADASGEIVVTRAHGVFPDGGRSARFRFARESPTAEALRALELVLVSGDEVVATTQQWVYVGGAVRKPGRYPYAERLTLSGLVSDAGGPLRGARRAVVMRRSGGGPRTPVLEADLAAIRSGKAEDSPLQPGDEVTLRARGM